MDFVNGKLISKEALFIARIVYGIKSLLIKINQQFITILIR